MDSKNNIKEKINRLAGEKIPFFFLIDFELFKPLIIKLEDIDSGYLMYDFNGITNAEPSIGMEKNIKFLKHPESYEEYITRFNKVRSEIALGNSYLVNLTCTTPIEMNCSLNEVFHFSKAKYRLWFNNEFVCFSPEIFIRIHNGVIKSFPMKGTIDANIPGAESVIMNDIKERAEHYTIVDLIRNDLNIVSHNVRVERFRYTDLIHTNNSDLLQVSSEVTGILDDDYYGRLGDIIFNLLPAGSVSGAPKKKTTEIIFSAEGCKRGYYTGIAGIFDGQNLDSCVLIRYIEKCKEGYLFRSGGGITSFSDPRAEYREMIQKIYVPLIRNN